MPANKTPPSFFLVPDEKKNYDSTVKLGNVIYEVARPDLVLFRPEKVSPPLPLGDLETPKTLSNYRVEKSDNKSSKYGLFAKILDFFGVGANVSRARGSEASECYEIKSMTIQTFDPASEFLNGLQAQDAIMDILKDGSSPRAFLITGVVVATGVVFKSTNVQERENEASLGVNASGVSLGPSGKRSKKRTLNIDWEIDEPTVLAFKVQKLQLKNEKLEATDEVEGAYFGADYDEPIKYEVDFDGELDEYDVGSMDGEIVEDDFTGGTCRLYLPED